MKRNCNNCKALRKSFKGIGCDCQFGYKLEATKHYNGIPISYKPLEECPKPTTIKEFFTCKSKYQSNYEGKVDETKNGRF